MEKVKIEQGEYGKRMILTSREWSKDLTEYFLNNDVKELYLNIAFGWGGCDISFLSELKGILALEILSDYIEDTSAIHCLRDIRSLSIGEILKDEIDFSAFPNLEEAYLNWSNKVTSLFRCKTLKKVLLCKYKSKEGDLSAFSNLPNLEELCFKVCNITRIGDVSGLQKLRILEIQLAPKLTSLEGIENLKELRRLYIDACRRITNIDPVGKLTKLEELSWNDGNIESLKPLINLKELRMFCLGGSGNVVDGDMTVLKSLPKLSDASFRERRHYNLRNRDMPGYKAPDLVAVRKILIEKGFSSDQIERYIKRFK